MAQTGIPTATPFNAYPECPAGSFTATQFTETGSTDKSGKTVDYYKGLLFEHENGGKGLITDIFNKESVKNYYDVDKQEWKAAELYLTDIKPSPTSTKTNETAYYLNQANEGNNMDNISLENISAQKKNDQTLLELTNKEYCMYRKYYNGFLNAFLNGITSNNANTPYVSQCLEILISLNTKLNALVSLIDHIANGRAGYVDARSSAMQTLNEAIKNQIAASPVSAEDIISKQNILNTRKEMIRYTKEKNNSISNHISLWAALNVVAIAMIFTLYRKI